MAFWSPGVSRALSEGSANRDSERGRKARGARDRISRAESVDQVVSVRDIASPKFDVPILAVCTNPEIDDRITRQLKTGNIAKRALRCALVCRANAEKPGPITRNWTVIFGVGVELPFGGSRKWLAADIDSIGSTTANRARDDVGPQNFGIDVGPARSQCETPPRSHGRVQLGAFNSRSRDVRQRRESAEWGTHVLAGEQLFVVVVVVEVRAA